MYIDIFCPWICTWSQPKLTSLLSLILCWEQSLSQAFQNVQYDWELYLRHLNMNNFKLSIWITLKLFNAYLSLQFWPLDQTQWIY